LFSTTSGAVLLILLVTSGASSAVRDIALSLAGRSFVLTTIAYVVMLALLTELVQLPFAYYQGVTLEQRYDLSTQTVSRWWRDHFKAAAIGLLFGTLAALLVMWLLRTAPASWWIIGAVCFIAAMVVLAQLAPVLLMPLFFEFKPLERPALVARLVALAERAGAPVLGVFEWRLGDRTKKANAALMGIGRTRRIILSDTLLAEHSDDEIEVILAHELAHHVHHDIWSGLAVEAALILAGFFAADVLLAALWAPLGLAGKADLAALPLLLLVGGGLSVVVMPLFNAFSRAHERRADRYALDMTRNAPAFVSAMKRLGVQNLAEERPSPIVELLFHSHPSISARVAAAHEWAARARP
jgi:STE24 endopeptidase